MEDFSLNPLNVFTENCKTYRNLAKPVTPVRFSFSVKFINNTFDKFNNICYCFLLSGAAIESHPGNQLNKKYFATNQLHCIFKGFSWVLHLLYYIQKGTISIESSFGDHQFIYWNILESSVYNCLSQLSFHSLYNQLSEQSILQLSLNQTKYVLNVKLGAWVSKCRG